MSSLIITERPLTDYRHESYQEMLAKGEWYEDYLVDLLRDNGLDAGRYKQDFEEINRIRRARGKCLLSEGLLNRLYPRYQRDCYIQVPGKRFNLETKARNGNPFQYPDVFVGKCKGWDSKRFKIHLIAITCQQTLETRFTLANPKIRAEKWIVKQSNDLCYSVPIGLFMSTKKFVELLKRKYNIS